MREKDDQDIIIVALDEPAGFWRSIYLLFRDLILWLGAISAIMFGGVALLMFLAVIIF